MSRQWPLAFPYFKFSVKNAKEWELKFAPQLRTCHSIWIQSAPLGACRPTLPPSALAHLCPWPCSSGTPSSCGWSASCAAPWWSASVEGGWPWMSSSWKTTPAEVRSHVQHMLLVSHALTTGLSWFHGVLAVGSVWCLLLSCPDVIPVSADGNLVRVPGQTRGESRRGACCWGRQVSGNAVNKN